MDTVTACHVCGIELADEDAHDAGLADDGSELHACRDCCVDCRHPGPGIGQFDLFGGEVTE